MTTGAVPGHIGWVDLTVPDADGVRDFYTAVTGWKVENVAMGGYSDYCMTARDGAQVAGVCHRRGPNENLPAVWLVYIVVDDLEASMAACRAKGGKVLDGPRSMGGTSRICVIQDPAGAVAALYQGA